MKKNLKSKISWHCPFKYGVKSTKFIWAPCTQLGPNSVLCYAPYNPVFKPVYRSLSYQSYKLPHLFWQKLVFTLQFGHHFFQNLNSVLIAEIRQTPPPPAFGLTYEGAVDQPRQTTSLCDPLLEPFCLGRSGWTAKQRLSNSKKIGIELQAALARRDYINANKQAQAGSSPRCITVKKISDVPVRIRDVTYQTLSGRGDLIIPARESLVSDIPAGDGKTDNFFYSLVFFVGQGLYEKLEHKLTK